MHGDLAGGAAERTGLEVAVIGLAGRFPGARTVDELWRNLCAGTEAITFFSDAELAAAGVGQALLARPDYVKAAGHVEGVELFDADFFGFTPREAEITDPQQRLFLECAWEALEAAGYAGEEPAQAIGVFAGAGLCSYALNVFSHPEVIESLGDFQLGVGIEKDHLATRVSYKLGLSGPSVTVQTACSSSLVSVHLACQALLAGECHMALAGGVSLAIRKRGYLFHEGAINSPDGHCRAFDAGARGTVNGSGMGVVVLKRLEDALADGDSIHAVIKGSAINNDGNRKLGYTAPSAAGQAMVIRAALDGAGVDPATVGYVEAHGTGTPLGDPVEVAALNQAFGGAASRRLSCALGSIKTNLGHLDAAAGVTGLIKTVLALERRLIPQSLHFAAPNPQIDFAGGPFFVNTSLLPWHSGGGPRRAGVSSFGIGGTNAHVVLEEAPPREAPGPSRPCQLLVLSARTATALERTSERLLRHLEEQPGQDLADVAYTLALGRKVFEHRRIVLAGDREAAIAALQGSDPQRVLTRRQQAGERPVVFLFPGQGAQHPGMAQELYETEPMVRQTIDSCAATLAPLLGIDLRRVLHPAAADREEAERRLAETALAQPALFAVEVALARLWLEWGVSPQLMLGHSLGEYAAACLAGVFSLDEGLRLVAARGRLMQRLPGGAMLAVELPRSELEPLLGDRLALAAVNGPQSSVVAGDAAAVAALESRLAARGVEHRRLRTSRAFHSPMMEPILEPFGEELARVRLAAPRLPYLSNLTGKAILDAEATDPRYWLRQLRSTALFGDALGQVWREPERILLEVGPGRALSTLARRHPLWPAAGIAVTSLAAGRERAEPAATGLAPALSALGRLWMAGARVDWRGFYLREVRRRVALPTYPFERRRYWLELQPGGLAAIAGAGSETEPAAAAAPGSLRDERAGEPASQSRRHLETAYVAPRDDGERQVAEIWQRLLGIAPIGVEDDFFELGGHSLLATRMVAALRQDLGVELSLREVIAAPRVGSIAAAVADRRRQQGGAATAAPPPVLAPDRARWHEPFPLTEVQEAYWVGRSGALALGRVATHVYQEIDVEDLDLPRLEVALRRLIERQGMLRAVVLPDGRQQILAAVPPYRIAELDLTHLPPAAAAAAAAALRLRMSHQVLPSDRWPLFQLAATRLAARRVRVHLSFDLLLGDAFSFGLMFAELCRFYDDPRAVLAPLEISFRDCVLAERKLRQSAAWHRAADYWRRRVPILPPAPELPLACGLDQLASQRFERHAAVLEPAAWRRLTSRGARAGVTPSGLLLAAFAEVLSTWSRTPRYTLNLPLFNRLPLHPQVGELVGDFTSLLLLEIDDTAGLPFEPLAQGIQQRLWEDLDHRAVSGVQVMRELAHREGRDGRALMPIVFTSVLGLEAAGPRAVADTATGEAAVRGGSAALDLAGEPVYAISQTPQVLLDFQAGELDGALTFNWDVVAEAFPAGLIAAMFGALSRRLERLAAEDGAWLEPVRGLVPVAQLALREQVNATAAAMPRRRLEALFRQQAAACAEQPAVAAPDRTLTYGELARRAAHLARRLRLHGAGGERLVAVLLPQGWRQAVAVLAILEAGGAYLPIEPTLPEERVLLLLAKGTVRIALTAAPWDEHPGWPPGIVRLSVEDEAPAADEAPAVDGPAPLPGPPPAAPAAGQEDLAYVIFTSGSTGEPKGVMIEHQAAANTILDINQRFQVGPGDRVLALSSLSFDLSVYDLFGTFAAGGTVVLPGPEARHEPARWLALLNERQVTVWNSVPALMSLLLDYVGDRAGQLPASLRLVLLSGDWLPLGLPDRLRALLPGVAMVSLGGATECAIWSVLHPVATVEPSWTSIPYGRPMSNQSLQVLDSRLAPRPVWVPGEICIGGRGLARGYLDAPEQTAASFIPDPRGGERLYRTGDLGRYLPDGSIELLGRLDFQVKIQGHRIELGEIEAALERHPAVHRAVVIAAGTERASRRLIAYVATDAAPDAAARELERFLRGKLPPALIPASFIPLAELPLTANGKIDRRALPAPPAALGTPPAWGERAGREAAAAAAAPLGEILAGLVGEVLGVDGAGAGDDFFALGGNSVLAMRLVARVRSVLEVEVPVHRVFESPGLAALAGEIEALRRAGSVPLLPPVMPAARGEEAELSFAQQRLWFLDQLHPRDPAHSLPLAFRLTGPLEARFLRAALAELVRRHEMLRTVFGCRDGRAFQRVLPPGPPWLAAVDLAALDTASGEREAARLLAAEARRGFDLSSGPLVRCTLLRLGGAEHVALLNLHHIVTDDWSNGLLFGELATLYRAAAAGRPSPLPELPLQYADFALWQRTWLQSEAVAEQVAYWRRRLGSAPMVLPLATDRRRPRLAAASCGNRDFALTAPLSQALRAVSRRQGVTLFMTLLALWQTLLSRLSGQDSVNVATASAGRTRFEIEGLIGFFVNTLVLRADLAGNPNLAELLAQVREVVLDAHAHQDLPFESVVEALAPPRLLSSAPLAQVFFVLQNAPAGAAVEIPGLTLRPLPLARQVGDFDMMLVVAEGASGIDGTLDYRADLFDGATVARLLAQFAVLLESAAGDPGTAVAELPLLSAGQRHQLLREWGGAGAAAGAAELPLARLAWQAERAGEAVAVSCGGEHLSYGELGRGSARLAHRLRCLGVEAGVPVGLLLERQLDRVIALVAVWKAGGAWTMLDPAAPPERLGATLAELRPALLVTERRLAARLAPAPPILLCLGEAAADLAAEPAADPEPPPAGGPACILHSAGDTGAMGDAKPWRLEHGQLRHLLAAARDFMGGGAGDTVLCAAPIDSWSGWLDLLVPLLAGGTCRLPAPGEDLASRLAGPAPPDRLHAAPAALRQALAVLRQRRDAALAGVRSVCVSGERLPADLLGALRDTFPAAELRILYGLAEAGGAVAGQRLGAHGGAPAGLLGRPLPGLDLRLLDRLLQPVPPGVAGEIWVAAEGVARGGDERSTATDRDEATLDGRRFRRGGDRARWRHDGRLELAGTAAASATVQGFPVETWEVEAALRTHPAVREALVLHRGDRLIAYVVAGWPYRPTAAELRNLLEERLPDVVAPADVVFLDQLPLTPGGRIDRRRLPGLPELPEQGAGAAEAGTACVAPRTPLEEELAAIWARRLGRDQIGVDDNFFALGGHSLLAISMIAEVRAAAGVPDLRLSGLFAHPTVARLALEITRLQLERRNEAEVGRMLAEIRALPAADLTRLLASETPALESAQ
jgi:amino acid adenylation domain-containing protein